MAYQVYRIAETGLLRDHETIFVETHQNGPQSGYLYHVTGTVLNGMVFEHRPAAEPEKSPMFAGKRKVGTVALANYPDRFIAVCAGVSPPKKQFKGARRLYPGEPVRRCGQWADEAVEALTAAGVLRQLDSLV
ncbi:hypothetical protein PHISP_06322, partial [Aspergillus sp. HF37]